MAGTDAMAPRPLPRAPKPMAIPRTIQPIGIANIINTILMKTPQRPQFPMRGLHIKAQVTIPPYIP